MYMAGGGVSSVYIGAFNWNGMYNTSTMCMHMASEKQTEQK